jgi:hypothetical protein
VHDNQHVLNWAAGAAEGVVDLERELAWLARVLEARDFPLDRLARNLEIGAGVVESELGEAGIAVRDALEDGTRFVRSRESFLEP